MPASLSSSSPFLSPTAPFSPVSVRLLLEVAITASKLEVVLLRAMSHTGPFACFLAFLTFQGNDVAAAWAQ